jgi:mannan endo-1,4-beta-mannosidase
MKGKRVMMAVLAVTAIMGNVCSCGTQRAGTGTATVETESQTKETFVPEVVGTYEAEDAACSGNVKKADSRKGYSGSGYVSGFSQDGDSCTFEIQISENGFYDLGFATAAGDYKENYVSVDGEQLGTITSEADSFSEVFLSRVYLEQGAHRVEVSKYWGYIDLDYLVVQTSAPLDSSIYNVSAELINKNATDNTKRLMSYLADNYGTNILSGQYCQDGMYGKEFTVIKNETGKTPAILGLDFIEYSPSRVAHGSTSSATELAIAYWNAGGIVTFCWHWNAPEKYLTGEWYSGFRTEATDIDLAKIMDGEDEEGYELLMEDIDAIATQLQVLQEAGVPVLWRPLHEASGGWFWWGASGAEAYKKLYRLLYDKLTNEYGLNNLIWLWNGQDVDWYPGDDYVDIIGEDLYPGEHVYTSQVNKYLQAVNYTDAKKMVVMSENGCVFDPSLAIRDGAMWGFWCTWGTEFVAKDIAIYTYSDQYTEKDKLIEFYNNEAVITQDEIPDLITYPIREELQ